MRKLSRNRRLAAVCASSASTLAASSSILLNGQHSTISSTAHEVTLGVIAATFLCLIGLSFMYLRRERGACSRTGNTEA